MFGPPTEQFQFVKNACVLTFVFVMSSSSARMTVESRQARGIVSARTGPPDLAAVHLAGCLLIQRLSGKMSATKRRLQRTSKRFAFY